MRATVSLAYPNAGDVVLAPGTSLRYDQRDYDVAWRQIGWDRFYVLDGPHEGLCVAMYVDMPGSPVSSLLEPGGGGGAAVTTDPVTGRSTPDGEKGPA